MAAPGRRKTVTRVVHRVFVEFGPPILLAAAWTGWKFAQSPGTVFEAVTNFSAAFVLASYIWLQLLRIIYQESQREFQVEQKAMLTGVVRALTGVSTSLTKLTTETRARTKDHPELQPFITRLASATTAANAQIAAANTMIEEIWRSTPTPPFVTHWYDLPRTTPPPACSAIAPSVSPRNSNASVEGTITQGSEKPSADG
jgi:hypothetical protein